MTHTSSQALLKNCEVVVHTGAQIPNDFSELRRSVFIDEKAFLDESSVSMFDHCGVHIGLREKNSKQMIASIQTYKSETGEFQLKSKIPQERLSNGITLTRLMVRKEFRGLSLGGALLYLAMQQGRLWGRSRVFLYTEDGEQATKRYIDYDEVQNAPQFVPPGKQSNVVRAQTQRLDLAISNCYEQLPQNVREFLQPFLAEEAINTVSSRLDQFFKNPWFSAIYEERLTKHQYVQTLANLHQFVRLTTRILARAVSITENSEMRKHFLEHLNGEIDHEIQIESDLRQVGANVDFVKHKMIPSVPTQQFMVIQESLLAFNQDPLSYIAVPFSIEGFTARLDDHFIFHETGLKPSPLGGITV